MLSHTTPSLILLRLLVACVLLSSFTTCHGWIGRSPTVCGRSGSATVSPGRIVLASSAAESLPAASFDDDDEEEYEYVEYDILTEQEFQGSEWLVGTVMDGRDEVIGETWVRLAIDKDGKNVAVWGDNSQGNWNFDASNQFLSVSKNALWGKNIWAGVVDDYYYCRGTVRGWNFFSPASVVGQWQAKRLGVEPGEAGIAPWFEEPEEEEQEETAAATAAALPDAENSQY